jgi:hypothetical protein
VILGDRLKQLDGTENAGSVAGPAFSRADSDCRRDPSGRTTGSSPAALQAIPTKAGVKGPTHPMLDELAELISQAWAEHESNNALSAPQDAIVQGEQGTHEKQPSLKVVSITPPNSETRGTAVDNKVYDASTQRIMRRMEALFATEESPPSAVTPVTRKLTPDR